MFKYSLIIFSAFIALIGSSTHLAGQEFVYDVTVQTPVIDENSKERFDQLEELVREYVNETNFTRIKNIREEEKLKGSININLREEIDQENFRMDVTISSRRPVHNSSYETLTYTHRDEQFFVEFRVGTNMTFSEQMSYQNNLTSVITFYLMTALAMDFDSFSELGGQKYWDNINNIFSQIPLTIVDSDKGWNPDETLSRGEFNQSLLNPNVTKLRKAWYKYHRLGLDIMYDDPEEGRANILSALRTFDVVNSEFPNLMFTQVFFNIKHLEIVSIFSEASNDQKKAVFDICTKINPARRSIYGKLMR